MNTENKALNMQKDPNFESDLQLLLNALRKETNLNQELVEATIYCGNKLKVMDISHPESLDIITPKDGIMGELWQEIINLRKSNYNLTNVTAHLQSVIGS
jgi:hypothetical protein